MDTKSIPHEVVKDTTIRLSISLQEFRAGNDDIHIELHSRTSGELPGAISDAEQVNEGIANSRSNFRTFMIMVALYVSLL
jgi:hypothetical protein